MEIIMDLVDKYLGEATKWEKVKDTSYTQEIFHGEAVSMARYDGYDLTVLYRNGKYIPVHGNREMKPVRSENEAKKILIKYVDKLPDESKIKGDNKMRWR